MAKREADIQPIEGEESRKFLITIPDLPSEEDEAKALAEAIENVRHRVWTSCLSDKKFVGTPPKEGFIPFRYEFNHDTEEVRLASVVIVFS